MDTALMKEYGIDCEKSLANCMGSEDFMLKIYAMFLEDKGYCAAEAAIGARSQKALFAALHELKGVAGNAGFSALYEAVCPLVELTRRGECDWEAAGEMFSKVKTAYEKTMDGIKLALGN